VNKEIKIYVIHYSKLKERKQSIKSILDPLNIEYEFIEDYDKEDLDNIDTNNFYVDDKSIFNEKIKLWKEKANKYRTMTRPELSCSIKHLEAIRKIQIGNHEFSLIIEDDVIPKNKDFLKQIEKLLLKNKSWDVLFIGEGMGEKYRKSKLGYRRFIPFKNILKMDHPATNCLEAYIIKKSRVNLILEGLIPINLVIDWELAYQFYKQNMNIYWSKKSIFYQGSKHNIYKSELRK